MRSKSKIGSPKSYLKINGLSSFHKTTQKKTLNLSELLQIKLVFVLNLKWRFELFMNIQAGMEISMMLVHAKKHAKKIDVTLNILFQSYQVVQLRVVRCATSVAL